MGPVTGLPIAAAAIFVSAATTATAAEISDADLENLVKCSSQYVALYNVNNKPALRQRWNTCDSDTQLKDHTMQDVARPNDDSLYIICSLDLRKDPVILEMPAFDSKYGFFMPNDRRKYSVGENGGMTLNEDGGIEIYLAGEKPEGVPEANWLPVKRGDYDMDLILRIYVPDLEKLKTWTPPKAEKLSS
jgi:hypothetical protein